MKSIQDSILQFIDEEEIFHAIHGRNAEIIHFL